MMVSNIRWNHSVWGAFQKNMSKNMSKTMSKNQFLSSADKKFHVWLNSNNLTAFPPFSHYRVNLFPNATNAVINIDPAAV